MNKSVFVIPGPETVILWGVHIPLLAATFGVMGICIGHWIAPVIGAPMPVSRHVGVILAGVLLSLGIAIATGQKPLVVLSWSIGIGFSGITIFQTMGAQARTGLKTLGDLVVERLAGAKTPPADPGADLPQGHQP